VVSISVQLSAKFPANTRPAAETVLVILALRIVVTLGAAKILRAELARLAGMQGAKRNRA
jgi:hypothetical protein